MDLMEGEEKERLLSLSVSGMNNKCSMTATDDHVSENTVPNYKGGRRGMSHVLKLQRWLVVEGVSWKKACLILLLSLLVEEWQGDLFGLTKT